MHPQSRVQNKKAHEVVTTGSPDQPGIPARNGFTAYFVLSPVIGLSCHRRLRNETQTWRQRRGVRTTRLRRPRQQRSSALPSRPPHPVPNVR